MYQKRADLDGGLVHGNRILAAIVFSEIGVTKLSRPLTEFGVFYGAQDVNHLCAEAHKRMVGAINERYLGSL